MLIKVVKNKAYFKRYQVKPRRRREGKTDYRARKRMTVQDKNKYNTPKRRVVVRFTNKDITVQFVHSRLTGDIVEEVAYSHELAHYGVKAGLTNQAASYLVGYLAGRRLVQKLNREADEKNLEIAQIGSEERTAPIYNLDVGLARTTTGAKIFTVLKGVVDAGIDVPHSDSRFFGYDDEQKQANPDAHRDRILGKHVSVYMQLLKDDDEDAYKRQFGKFIELGITPESLEAMYKKARDAIEANPARVEHPKKDIKVQRWTAKALTLAERKARVVTKKAELLEGKN